MLIAVALGLAWAERRAAAAVGTSAIGPAAVATAAGGAAAVATAASREARALGLGAIVTIGCFQALALIPGASRSGSTILGGLWLGLRREEAARFSFLLGVPAILGAGLFQVRALWQEIAAGGGPGGGLDAWGLALGLAVAAISGYASIGFLLRYLKTRSTLVFIVYRVALGLAMIALTALGWIE